MGAIKFARSAAHSRNFKIASTKSRICCKNFKLILRFFGARRAKDAAAFSERAVRRSPDVSAALVLVGAMFGHAKLAFGAEIV